MDFGPPCAMQMQRKKVGKVKGTEGEYGEKGMGTRGQKGEKIRLMRENRGGEKKKQTDGCAVERRPITRRRSTTRKRKRECPESRVKGTRGKSKKAPRRGGEYAGVRLSVRASTSPVIRG